MRTAPARRKRRSRSAASAWSICEARAAVRARQVADEHARGGGVGGAVVTQDREQEADEAVGAPSPPPAVGHALVDVVPREVVEPRRGQLDAAHETAGAGTAEGQRRPR